jgi:hypothetical protein
MEETLANFTLFNRIKLKMQKQKELENMCNESIRLIQHTEDEMVDFFKFSNGIVTNDSKAKNILNPLHAPFRRNYGSKRNIHRATILSNRGSIKEKRSRLFSQKFESTEMRETLREYIDDKDLNLKQSSKKEDRRSQLTLPTIVSQNTINSAKNIEASSRSELSDIRELMPEFRNKKPPAKIKNTELKKSTQKVKKAELTSSYVPTESCGSPIESKFIALTEPCQRNSQKLINDLHKLPAKNTKKRFSKIYDEFNSIWKNNIELATNIEKSHDKYFQKLFNIYNREHIEQNKMFDDADREKLFVMEEKKKKDIFSLKLDKHHVLKEYNLINILRDEFAVDVMKKYVKLPEKAIDQKQPRNKNHKKVLEILDAMQLSKYC